MQLSLCWESFLSLHPGADSWARGAWRGRVAGPGLQWGRLWPWQGSADLAEDPGRRFPFLSGLQVFNVFFVGLGPWGLN